MKLILTTYGSARSGYDAKVRAIASQYLQCEFGLESTAQAIRNDIAQIKRKNSAVADHCYTVKVIYKDGLSTCIEIWNEVFPGKERLIATLRPLEDTTGMGC